MAHGRIITQMAGMAKNRHWRISLAVRQAKRIAKAGRQLRRGTDVEACCIFDEHIYVRFVSPQTTAEVRARLPEGVISSLAPCSPHALPDFAEAGGTAYVRPGSRLRETAKQRIPSQR